MAMGFSGCGFPRRNTDNIDGGVVTRNSGEDSPKVIKSTDVISFNCELSFIATVFDEENELEGKVYKMSAALEDGTIKAKIDWHDRSGNGDKAEFEADAVIPEIPPFGERFYFDEPIQGGPHFFAYADCLFSIFE